jgi:hypothetical protein
MYSKRIERTIRREQQTSRRAIFTTSRMVYVEDDSGASPADGTQSELGDGNTSTLFSRASIFAVILSTGETIKSKTEQHGSNR